ncbi:putative Cation/H+ exchanger 4 [Hibiscus syriacus]|uniref:Cation/H+ exchanger 4 n=1 Tax=Hibiscus syriacus TaxID=106335 RepID=A0A6A2YT98_HIBSY|nr:putative Cation/H+ exchanger 4 [Hibiscus syriacus]
METVEEEICLSYPPKVNAPGLMTLLSNVKPENILDYSAPRLELQIVLTFILTQAIHFVLKRLRMPTFISQILAGIILGPTVLDREKALIIMSEESVSILGSVATFGFMLYLFLTGVKMDFSMTYRSGKKTMCIGILTVMVPFIICLLMAGSDREEITNYNAINEVSVLALAYSATSFPVVHSLLSELKLLNSELGRLSLSSALVGNVLSLFLLTICQGLVAARKRVRKIAGDGKIKGVFLYAAILAFMVSHQLSTYFKIFVPFGPFLAGLAIQDGPPLGSALVEKLDPVVSGFLMPLFASTCGMRIDFTYLNDSSPFVKHQAFSAIVALIVITTPIFVCMTLIVVVVASIVPMLVKTLYNPSRKYASYHKRSIMHCRHNEDLRMISCIHVPANVNSIIDILSTSTPESPIVVHVLHLIKLSGRATPLFISHDMNQYTLSNESYSENVVLSFKRFERDNWESVTVKAFTAVSPTNLITESEDQNIRSLNYNMLERAPCSIGILVEGRCRLNRSFSQSSFDGFSSYSIAVIFLGGKDDQEALALGIRMSENKNVQLTVIHLTSGNRILADDTETMQDEIMLRNVKEVCSYITHIEKQVSDGPETLDFLRSIVDNYQLFIVGRRYKREDPQTMGLHEWTEFQEIGIIGDLLSSADFGGNNSVLVVQKQQWID